jgi:hypothetical protein
VKFRVDDRSGAYHNEVSLRVLENSCTPRVLMYVQVRVYVCMYVCICMYYARTYACTHALCIYAKCLPG